MESKRQPRLSLEVFSAGQNLPEGWISLAAEAKRACASSYSPYSGFRVGAAVELAGGEFVQGANQENGSYPCGLCAERVALFSAVARGNRVPVLRLAIAARQGNEWVQRPVTPCGACRQVMLEVVQMQRATFPVLMLGEEEVWLVHDVRELLPLAFTLDA